MPKIYVTRGLPGSGKTTWSMNMVTRTGWFERVNRDDLRHMLFNVEGVGTSDQEQAVSRAEKQIVQQALKANHDVIVDATNLRAKYSNEWFRLGEVEFVDFPVTIEAAIARDAHRHKMGGRYVGETVIRQMAKRYGIKEDGVLPKAPRGQAPLKFEPIPDYDPEKTDAIVVDIDGTLANHFTDGVQHRSPYDTSLYHLDTLHENVARIVNALAETHIMIVTSGRSEEFRAVTEEWLVRNNIHFDELHMRGADDKRNDSIVKHDLYHEYIGPNYNVVMIFDDRDRVVEAWRAMGLTVAQVAYGAF